MLLGKFYDALKVSGPARLASPITFLELFTFDFAYLPVMMPKLLSEDEPLERLRLLSAALIGGFQCGDYKHLAK